VLLLQMGFDALFFARADYQDLLQRRKDRTMEMIWQGSKSLGSSAEVGSTPPLLLQFLSLTNHFMEWVLLFEFSPSMQQYIFNSKQWVVVFGKVLHLLATLHHFVVVD
jgi:hypothetical protein